MAANDFFVSVSVDDAVRLLENTVVDGSFTGEMIDYYVMNSENGRKIVVIIFEKHFYRAGNRLTLTVTLDDLTGVTRVHAVGGGGGEGLFRFDWGASESFSNAAYDALEKYIQ